MSIVVKIIFVLTVFLTDYNLVYTQAVTWQKWYDYNNLEDEGEDVIQTYDGNYLILSNNYVIFNYSSVLTKVDEFGNILWQKLYDRNNIGGSFLSLFSVTQTSDSGYILSGDNRDSALMIRTDKIGNILWIKKFSPPGNQAAFFSNHINSNNGIICCGAVFGLDRGYIVKTDTSGNLEWYKIYSSTWDIRKLIESKNHEIYFLAIDSALTKGSSLLAKANSLGEITWIQNLNLPNPVSLFEYPSGQIFAGGGLDSMILYRLDTSGSISLQKSYFNGVEGCGVMCLSKEGNILLSGTMIVNSAFLMAVSKVKPNGNLIYNKIIPSLKEKGDFSFLSRSVTSTDDYGFVFTGFTDYPPEFHESNIFVSKTDSLCNAPLIVNIDNNNHSLPKKFILHQNYPNPFNPVTKISYSIPKSEIVKIKIYDIAGKEILLLVNEAKDAGRYEIQFDGSNLSSGVYFYKLEAGSFISTKRMVLIK